MRLSRRDTRREPEPLLVGVVTPTVLSAAPGLEELFRDAYLRLHSRALCHAERFLSRGEAEDAVGEAALKVWRLWPHLRPEQRNDAYFMAAVRTKVRETLKKSGRFISLDDAEPELEEVSAAEAEWSATEDRKAEVLDNALAEMPAKRREILLLIYEHDISWQQAAEELGLKIGTINAQMHRARTQLRAAFTRAGFRIAGLGLASARRASLAPPSEDSAHD